MRRKIIAAVIATTALIGGPIAITAATAAPAAAATASHAVPNGTWHWE